MACVFTAEQRQALRCAWCVHRARRSELEAQISAFLDAAEPLVNQWSQTKTADPERARRTLVMELASAYRSAFGKPPAQSKEASFGRFLRELQTLTGIAIPARTLRIVIGRGDGVDSAKADPRG